MVPLLECAQVRLYVALPVVHLRIDIALELREHLRDALADHVREQRQASAVGHAHHHFQRAVHANTNSAPLYDSQPAEIMGQLIGPLIQLLIRELNPFK